MNNIQAENFMRELVQKAMNSGFLESEACFMQNYSMSVSILNGEVSSYENSDEQGISFRGKINDQMGYASTTKLDAEAIDFLLAEAKENAMVQDDDDNEFIYCDSEHKKLYHDQTTPSFSKNTCALFSSIGLSLEKAILDIDPCVESVDYLSISCGSGPLIVMNSAGLSSYKNSDYVSIFADCRGKKNDVVKSAGHFWFGNDLDNFSQDKFVATLKNKLMGKFGASSVKSGTYNIILQNEALISLVSTFFGAFSSYNMQKGLSLLKGKEGTMIASPIFNLREEPSYDKALIKVPFDSEGVLTYAKDIIKDGEFITALYNLKTATKEGRKSTGNGFRSSYAGSVGIMFSNLIVVPGEKSFDELCEELKDGIIITDLNGLHAGVNTISGDFSLQSEGYLVENGKIVRPVEQITVADNFFELIKKISVIGNDTISYPDGEGEFFSPSVIINSINVSGNV